MKTLQQSQAEYDLVHQDTGLLEEPEYYQVVGTLLKGVKSLDVGCGYGHIERYSPGTVALDFSGQALKVAQKNGAFRTVKAAGESLPFQDNEFDVAASIGVLEHCLNQEKAISEIVRVSSVQCLIVHAKLPYGLESIRKPVLSLFGLRDQPVEEPLSMEQLKTMLRLAGSRVIVEGVWNYIDLRWLWRKIPYGIVKWPSHHFVLAVKTGNLERRFLGENP